MAYWDIVDDSGALCGECPVWDEKEQCLYWIDAGAGELYRFRPASAEKQTVLRGLSVTGYALRETGGFILATREGIYRLDRDGALTLLTQEFQGKPLSCNDAAAGPRGRFLFGTNYYDNVPDFPRGALYSMEPDGRISLLDEGFGLANGIGFSPDERTLYAVDSCFRRVWAYDYDPDRGTVSGKRLLIRIPDNEGVPDGLTVDAQGDIWLAQWYGYGVYHYSADGELLLHLPLPDGQTSSLIFGGKELTELYVTSAAHVDRDDFAPRGYDFDAPHYGRLYRLPREVKGKPEYRTAL